MTKQYKDLYIVGLGASAGGFEALHMFLENVEPHSNITYVIVQHLDPNQPTMLGTLLSKYTKLPIEVVKNKTVPKENTIYYCPPNKDLTIIQGKFILSEPQKKEYPKPSVNKFFESLAIEKKEKAIGVVLSGTGSDGAIGIEAIHENQGITIAEDEGAKYFSMPKAAIDTGVVDVILPPLLIAQGIPKVIKDRNYFVSQYEVKGSVYKLFELLEKKTNINFSSYKENTILRRINKRITETKNIDIDGYLEYIQKNDQEIEILKNELLIIVTSFFRGQEAFKELEKHLFELIKNKEQNNIRVWIPACATGEEAYTIAIVIKEILKKLQKDKKVTIFATDVSNIAIESARGKVFTLELMDGLSEKQKVDYFTKNNNGYRPKKELRDMIIFSQHDVIKDPPFSNLDLISCRNLLIYFDNNLQKVIMSAFYYALRYGGLLFLGQSETVGNLNNLFSTIHNKNKLYKKTTEIANIMPETLSYSYKKNFITHSKNKAKEQSKVNEVEYSINKAVSNQFGKNGILIDGKTSTILFYKGDTAEYISQPKGVVTQDIFRLVQDYLKLDLRATINEARKKNIVATSKKVRALPLKSSEFYVLITVFPLDENKLGDDTFFITFDKIQDKEFSAKKEHCEITNSSEVSLLEDELSSLKERLQITIEELETSNEELQSTNEELQSTNEELQSTNEELETSNEELQSTNEELQTVNDELNFKNSELEFSHKAFNSVLSSIKTDVLIVDSRLNILKYTNGILKFFDIDKANLDNFSTVLINSTVSLPNLVHDLKKSLHSGEEIQYEVTLGKKIYLFKVNKITMGITGVKNDEVGLVISFLDRTELFEKDKLLFQQSKMAAMGEMIGNIAHQWRQPLNILGIQSSSFVEKIESKSYEDHDVQKYKKTYQEQIEHMSQTIDDFKDFFKPSKSYQKQSLENAVKQAIDMVEDSFKFNQIEIIKEKTDYSFYGSKNELAQVLLNLFSNSKDAFIQNKIARRKIEILFKKEKKNIVITVRDNAGGVDSSILNQIGDAYFSTKKETSGTGIGLYMCKLILEQMHGKLEFCNNNQSGLDINIYLPQYQE